METGYRQIIETEFSRRAQRNPNYSLRAFARDLGLSPGRLSLILNRKSGLSPTGASKLSRNLGLSEPEQELFQCAVAADHGRSPQIRENARRTLEKNSPLELQEISEDLFALIADWFHLAMVELMQAENFKTDLKWMAQRLGITWAEAKDGWGRLLRLKVVEPTQDGAKNTNLSVWSKAPSRAIRHFHSQMLDKAKEALDGQAIEERDFSTIMLHFSPARMEELQQEIREFRRHIIKKYGKREEGAEIYSLQIQFFRLTKNLAAKAVQSIKRGKS